MKYLLALAKFFGHHPSLHRTLPRHGIFFWVWSGWQWGQLGYRDIVCWRNSEECFPLCPSSSHHLHSQPQQYGLCSTEFPSIHPQYHTITTHHGGRTYNGNPIQGMLILLLLNTSLSTHINMTHARDFYLPWYWAVGSGCFADIDIIFFAIAARCIIYYLFYCPPFTPIIPSSIILAQISQGMTLFSGCVVGVALVFPKRICSDNARII